MLFDPKRKEKKKIIPEEKEGGIILNYNLSRF